MYVCVYVGYIRLKQLTNRIIGNTQYCV